MLSHTGEKPFICKQCNYLFVYLHIRHPGTSFLRSSYNYIFKNIAYVIVYVWPSRTWDEILLPFQKGLFFPLGDIRLFLPTRIRICAYAHHPTWIRHGRIRMAIPNLHVRHLGTLFLRSLYHYLSENAMKEDERVLFQPFHAKGNRRGLRWEDFETSADLLALIVFEIQQFP